VHLQPDEGIRGIPRSSSQCVYIETMDAKRDSFMLHNDTADDRRSIRLQRG